MVTALMVQPERNPCITQLCCDGLYLNYAVSKDCDTLCCASMFALEKDIAVVYAADGIFYNMKPNRRVGKQIVCGTFYIVKVKNKTLCSLTDKKIVKYSLQFREREWWTDSQAIDAVYDELENA